MHGDMYRLTRNNVDQVPEAPGVYALYEGGQVIYVGAAIGRGETIRSRLREHLAGSQPPGRATAKAFSYEVTRYPLSRERALLEEERRNRRDMPTFKRTSSGGAEADLGHGVAAHAAPAADTAAAA